MEFLCLYALTLAIFVVGPINDDLSQNSYKPTDGKSKDGIGLEIACVKYQLVMTLKSLDPQLFRANRYFGRNHYFMEKIILI